MCSRPHLVEPMSSLGKWPNIPIHVREMLFKKGFLTFIVSTLFNYFVFTFTAFPSWFLKKFLFGFPKMWKEYLDQFLSGHMGYVGSTVLCYASSNNKKETIHFIKRFYLFLI